MIALRRNVLIFHQAALGDFALTWPIAMAAARLWPTSRVIYVTGASKGALAERAIGVEWRDGDAWHGLFDADVAADALPPAAAKVLAGATLILSFVSTGNDAWAANVRRLAPEAQLVCVTPRPAGELDRHVTVFHAEQLAERPDLQAATGGMLRHVAAAGVMPRRGEFAGPIVIHPGSGGASKCWPAEGFAGLARELSAAGHAVRIVLGEVERETWPPAALAAVRAAADVIQPTTPTALFDALRGARAYVGNDSGPTHLAALAGVPTLALFGRDNDVGWRPLGRAVRVLKHAPLDGLDVEAVVAATLELLAMSTPEAAAVIDEE